MKLKFSAAVAAGFTGVLASAPAQAQQAGDVTVRVAGARTKLVDEGEIRINGTVDPTAGYSTRDTYHGTLSVSYFPLDMLGLDASISTPITTNNLPAGSLAGTPNLGDDEFVLATIGARVQPFSGQFSPYVGGGMQFQITTGERDGLGVDLNIPSTSGPYVEGGVEFHLSERLGFFAAVRKAWYSTEATGLLPLDATFTNFAQVSATAELDPVTIMLGATTRFGRRAKAGGGPIGLDTSRWTIRAGVTGLSLADRIDLSVGGQPFAGADLSTREHYTASVQIGYFLTPHFGVNATLGLPPTVNIYGGGSIGALPQLGKATYGPTALTLQYHPLRHGRIRPYVGAGLSYMIVFDTEDGAFADLEVDNDVGFAFEAGTDFMINNSTGVFIDVKKALLRPVARGTFNGQPVIGETRLDPWAFSAGVAFHF